ncbi:sensor domain-containing diguanylate cyclase [Maridesulfovibrio frigidus]|uniref:sensor domain-containing diguanylate cyclase n=1 Tax=Maridesulfovibrio frigidus TaxID=340956 RepID=UPI00146FBC2E|nr:diguanylate cyclase [Maridesulfovibrio frigidus]
MDTLVLAQPNSVPSYEVSGDSKSLQEFDIYVAEDIERNLTVDDISSGKINWRLTSSRFNIKSTELAYWFCFALVNKSTQPVRKVISLDEPFAEQVILYYRNGNLWHKERAGLDTPLLKRSIDNRNPVFSIKIEPGQSKTFYIKLHSNYGMLTDGIFVDSPSAFLKREQLATACYFFYFGTISALIFYNLFLFISLRDKLYGYYVMHGLCFGAWVMLYSGFDLYLGISELAHYRLNSITNFILVFLALFSRELLQTKLNLPKIDKVLLLIIGVSFLSGIASFININYYQYLNFLALPTYAYFMFVGIYAWVKRIKLSSYYLLSMSFYFVSIILLGLLLMDLVPYSLTTRYAYLGGSMAELTIFSLALAYRVKLLQKQNISYQQELILAEREAKGHLEIEVAHRTSELRQANQELARMAKQDGLTGLANRRLLDERLLLECKRLKRENSVLSVIMCDVDYFKNYNDYYGHQEGDGSLIKVARAIESSLKRPNDLAGRYGGEEFLIILPNTDAKGAVEVAERIMSTVSDMRIEHEKSKISDYLTFSFGVASVTSNEVHLPENIILVADEALYRAKRQGRNQVCN